MNQRGCVHCPDADVCARLCDRCPCGFCDERRAGEQPPDIT